MFSRTSNQPGTRFVKLRYKYAKHVTYVTIVTLYSCLVWALTLHICMKFPSRKESNPCICLVLCKAKFVFFLSWKEYTGKICFTPFMLFSFFYLNQTLISVPSELMVNQYLDCIPYSVFLGTCNENSTYYEILSNRSIIYTYVFQI